MLQALNFATFSGICRGLLGLLFGDFVSVVRVSFETSWSPEVKRREQEEEDTATSDGTNPVTMTDARSWSGEQLRSGACWRLVAAR